jgi:hypothetical protein
MATIRRESMADKKRREDYFRRNASIQTEAKKIEKDETSEASSVSYMTTNCS